MHMSMTSDRASINACIVFGIGSFVMAAYSLSIAASVDWRVQCLLSTFILAVLIGCIFIVLGMCNFYIA